MGLVIPADQIITRSNIRC